MIWAYFDYYDKCFFNLSGFDIDIGSFLICMKIWIDVCPWQNHFLDLLEGDLEDVLVWHMHFQCLECHICHSVHQRQGSNLR